MRRGRTKTLASFTMIGAGAALLFFGARDFLESQLGQSEAAQEYEIVRPIPPSNRKPDAASIQPAVGTTIGRLMIPRLSANLYVLEGDGPGELRRGPGHLTGTAMPGESGNCVIAAHRDTHFRVLKDIRRGDRIVLETPGGNFQYRVQSTRVVSPKNTDALQPTPNAELNLITCYPFYYLGPAPKRFVVEAQLESRDSSPVSAADRRPQTLSLN